MAPHPQDHVQRHSLTDPESFWAHHAEHLHWHKKPSSTLLRTTKKLPSGTSHQHWTWFPDGEISTSYNCLDRHVLAGNGDSPAIIYDSPVTGTKRTYNYKEVLEEVEVLAGVLKQQGIKRGDVVLVYMPMIPAALFAILAISRLGAIHAVVFGGFAAASLAQRIEASNPRVIMTASCGVEGAKGALKYQPFVEGAVELSKVKPARVLVWQRDEAKWQGIDEKKGVRDWKKLVDKARQEGVREKGVAVKSDEGLYIIYTSGRWLNLDN
jgi:propionyl-CoA synthetase